MKNSVKAVNRVIRSVAIVLAFLITAKSPVPAHETRPVIIHLEISQSGPATARFVLNLEDMMVGMVSGHDNEDVKGPDVESMKGGYKTLRALKPGLLEKRFRENDLAGFLADLTFSADGKRLSPRLQYMAVPSVGNAQLIRLSELFVQFDIPKGAKKLTWQWPSARGRSVLRFSSKNKDNKTEVTAFVVNPGAKSPPIDLSQHRAQSAWAVFLSYIPIGFDHIVPKGLDHILFVVGLFLLTPRFRPLLWQVTSFTVAHTVTLALASLGVVALKASIVEPLIALSICYVAVENIRSGGKRDVGWTRLAVVFGFGLLHGLGFASVLSDFGLSDSGFVAGLIGFNIGVELGQLAVIALCFFTVGMWFGTKSWYRARVSIPASLFVAAIGGWWFLERTLLAA